MEIKKIKNKSRHAPVITLKPKRVVVSRSKPKVVDMSGETRTETEAIIHKNDMIIPADNIEAVFTEDIEVQDVSFAPSWNIDKKFFNTDLIKRLGNKKEGFLAFIPWLLLAVFLVLSFYLWFQLSKNDSLKINDVEISKVTTAVGKILVLPTGEVPKIATLTEADLQKVKTQSFFVNAKVGDNVLVYSIARKVILYSPKINKIIEVANLNSDSSSVSSPSL